MSAASDVKGMNQPPPTKSGSGGAPAVSSAMLHESAAAAAPKPTDAKPEWQVSIVGEVSMPITAQEHVDRMIEQAKVSLANNPSKQEATIWRRFDARNNGVLAEVELLLAAAGHPVKYECGGITITVQRQAAAAPKPAAAPLKPELYEEAFGPYKTAQEAMAKRDDLMAKSGFPMVSQSSISQQKSGFILAVTFRSRFPPSLPHAAIAEELHEWPPSAAADSKDEKA